MGSKHGYQKVKRSLIFTLNNHGNSHGDFPDLIPGHDLVFSSISQLDITHSQSGDVHINVLLGVHSESVGFRCDGHFILVPDDLEG